MISIPFALTYDDVLIVPRRSTLTSRQEASTKTQLTKRIEINTPIITANMDTVTDATMAIAIARLGGIGIVHRFMSIEQHVEHIKKVKRAQNQIVQSPYIIHSDATVAEAEAYTAEVGITGLLVANGDNRLLGILSRRDFIFSENKNVLVRDIMTPRERLIVGDETTTFPIAKQLLLKHKIEKLPLVDAENKIVGLITLDDMKHTIDYPNASLDKEGQLLVGGAVGVHGDYIERAIALQAAGANVLVIDIAHGHSDNMFRAIKHIREAMPDIELIAGNIATAQAAYDLCEAGADGLKVGVGPGSICITRLVTGCGMPQLSAVMNVASVAKKYGVPVIADGGIQRSGDIVKAIGAGADSVMIGSMFAGTTESPGGVIQKNDKKYKICRGSASYTVSSDRKEIDQEKKKLKEIVPEGVESIVPFKGPIADIVQQLLGGIRSGMSYVNARTIPELKQNVTFVRLTSAGSRESGVHDVEALTS